MTAPFAPPPNRLQALVLSALPAAFVAMLFLRTDGVLGTLAFALMVYANAALWGALIYGFVVNVVMADRDPGPLDPDVNGSETRDGGE